MNPRLITVDVLSDVLLTGCSLTAAFHQRLTDSVSIKNQSMIKEQSFGVLRWYHQLQAIKSALLLKPMKTKDFDIELLILLGVYQILHMRTPDYAAVSETVSCAKALNKRWATGLLNKVLRRFTKEKAALLKAVSKSPSAQFSHPAWLITAIKRSWPNEWEAVLANNNERPPMFIRVNQQQLSRSDYLTRCGEKLALAQVAPEDPPTSLRLLTPVSTRALPGFETGACSVQDLAGQKVFDFLDLLEGHRVLDACSAPGSKACHILESKPGVSSLVAIDKDANRLVKVRENIDRLQLKHKNVQLIAADANDVESWWDKKPFDRILLDAPCSATGVIRRHPDIKMLRRESDISALANTQKQLLNALWKTLAHGGKLIYTTCSVLPEENDAVIEAFLQAHDDAKVLFPVNNWGIKTQHGMQLLPTKDGGDGFYYCVITQQP